MFNNTDIKNYFKVSDSELKVSGTMPDIVDTLSLEILFLIIKSSPHLSKDTVLNIVEDAFSLSPLLFRQQQLQ